MEKGFKKISPVGHSSISRIINLKTDQDAPNPHFACTGTRAFGIPFMRGNNREFWALQSALGVTKKTGWFMLQRIRLAMQNNSIVKMGGDVESDE